jgi:hypothetical protein
MNQTLDARIGYQRFMGSPVACLAVTSWINPVLGYRFITINERSPVLLHTQATKSLGTLFDGRSLVVADDGFSASNSGGLPRNLTSPTGRLASTSDLAI